MTFIHPLYQSPDSHERGTVLFINSQPRLCKRSNVYRKCATHIMREVFNLQVCAFINMSTTIVMEDSQKGENNNIN